MSPKDGTAGTAVAPAVPKAPKEADKADPGEMSEIKARQREQKAGKYGSVPSKAYKETPAEAASEETEQEKKEKTWIAIKLTRSDGSPGAGEAYEIGLEGQVLASGTLDEKGEARVDGLDPQTCKVSFPNLDKSAWKPE